MFILKQAIKTLLRKFGFIHRSELNNFPRGLIKARDEYREDLHILIDKIRSYEFNYIADNVFLLSHFQYKDEYFDHLYSLYYGKGFFEFSPITKEGDGYRNSLGHYLRRSSLLSDEYNLKIRNISIKGE